jgi:hypothetical protein
MTEHDTRDQADERAARRLVADAARHHIEAMELVETTRRLAAEMIAQAERNADQCGQTFERLRAEFGEPDADAELAPPCVNCEPETFNPDRDDIFATGPEPVTRWRGCQLALTGARIWHAAHDLATKTLCGLALDGMAEHHVTPAMRMCAACRQTNANDAADCAAETIALAARNADSLAAEAERLIYDPWALAAIAAHPRLLIGARVQMARDDTDNPAVFVVTSRDPNPEFVWVRAESNPGMPAVRATVAELRPVRAR